MSFLDKILGNASSIQPEKLQRKFAEILTTEETIEHAFKLVRDLIIFTNRRLLLVNKQGITGNKIEYHSIPYSNIAHYRVETAGHFDRDAELILWISGVEQPIRKQFNKNVNIYEVQSIITKYAT